MKIGFIGCGNMGQAMLSGMLDSGKVKPQDIIVTDKLLASRVNTQKKQQLWDEMAAVKQLF